MREPGNSAVGVRRGSRGTRVVTEAGPGFMGGLPHIARGRTRSLRQSQWLCEGFEERVPVVSVRSSMLLVRV